MSTLPVKNSLFLGLCVLPILILGCATQTMEPSTLVLVKPTQSSTVTGEIAVSRMKNGIRMKGQVSGLKPNMSHGFHVHEKGDCSSPDASSAGGHFNPSGQAHGHYDNEVHHLGDLPSLQANAQGIASFDIYAAELSLETGKINNIKGKAVVVHRDSDDGKTQPTGNSGPRLACGVI